MIFQVHSGAFKKHITKKKKNITQYFYKIFKIKF